MKFKIKIKPLNLNFLNKFKKNEEATPKKGKINNKAYKKIAISVLVISLLGVNLSFLLIYNQKLKVAQESYIADMTSMQEQLEVLGDVRQVFFVNKDKDAGEAITKEDLISVSIPSTYMSKEYILTTGELPKAFYKVSAKAGTPLTKSILMADPISQQDRFLDVTGSVFPVELKVGDYVDVLLTSPNGGTFRVLSKKRISKVRNSSVELMCGDIDTHTYESAMTDLALNPGTKIYCVTYVEPGLQESPISFYPVNIQSLNSMEMNPSIEEIKNKDLILKRRKIFEKGLEVSDKEQALLISGRNTMLERLQSDVTAYKSALSQEEVVNEEIINVEGNEGEAANNVVSTNSTDAPNDVIQENTDVSTEPPNN